MSVLFKLRIELPTAAMALVCMALVACGDRDRASRSSPTGVEFGIWVPNAGGEPRFVVTADVPYLEDQPFGWRVRGGRPDVPVKWVETLRLPAVPRSWDGVAESPNVTISADGKSATTFGQSLPGDEFVGNVWYVGVGDPTGEYEISVELEDGRKAVFRFRLVTAEGGPSGSDVI